MRFYALSLLGAALLGLPARRYRVDRLLCESWPPPAENVLHGALYLLALALLTAGWLGLARRPWRSLRQVLLLAVPAHALLLIGPPFLSQDPVFYAALGRSMATFHADAYTPLARALPAGDRFLQLLPPHWQIGTSPYFAGWNELMRLIARLGAGDVAWHLRLYQGVGLLSMLLCGGLAGRAAGPRAAALVLFCPLALIEGTGNGHNDAVLAALTALFALCAGGGRPREVPALLSLLAGLLVKASALLLLGFYGLELLFLRLRAPARRLLPPLLAGTLLLLLAFLLLRSRIGMLNQFSALLGGAGHPYEYCTRSVECLPRALLRYVLLAPRAAFVVGLGFRVASAVLFLCLALGPRRDRDPLRWAATALFFYYLYFHAWSQSWYLLPLLPLLPYADRRLYPAMLAFLVSSVAYYALYFPLNCVTAPLHIALADFFEALVEIVPPTVLLLYHGPRPRRTLAHAA